MSVSVYVLGAGSSQANLWPALNAGKLGDVSEYIEITVTTSQATTMRYYLDRGHHGQEKPLSS